MSLTANLEKSCVNELIVPANHTSTTRLFLAKREVYETFEIYEDRKYKSWKIKRNKPLCHLPCRVKVEKQCDRFERGMVGYTKETGSPRNESLGIPTFTEVLQGQLKSSIALHLSESHLGTVLRGEPQSHR